MDGRVVLGVSGGIAAYRAVELLRELQREGCSVRVIMTRHAAEFVTPRTFAVLSGHPVEVDQWSEPTRPGVDHVELARWADVLVVAPATANLLAKMAAGVADDALTTYHLAHRREVVVAPAMNTHMWRHPATREAVERLRARGVKVVPPAAGPLACGDEGEGRLAPVPRIVEAALARLPRRGPLAGLSVLVTSGPTREPVDAVRVLTNRSSGRMGSALAAEARRLGAEVTLIHGPQWVPPPPGVHAVPVETAAGMGRALEERLGEADLALLAAAVADFRPAAPAAGKLDRREGGLVLELEPVPDLAAEAGRRPDRPYLVVFAAEMGADRERALAKMRAKGADAVALNDVTAPGIGMEAEENEVVLLLASGREVRVPRAAKRDVARELLLALAGEVLARRALRAGR